MNIPLLINGALREASLEYATSSDLDFLDLWREKVRRDKHPVRVDAVNFANLACKRYKAHAPVENYATAPDDIKDYVKDNPHSEVAVFALLKCRWFPECDVVGLAHFRRSWCNNLILDYLASHPWIARPPAGFDVEVRGVGLGIMYGVCKTAVQNDCGAVWGEATQNSCGFYRGVFKLESVSDLLYIPRQNMVEFLEGQDRKWLEIKKRHGRD